MGERDLIAGRTGLSPLLAPLLRARSTYVRIRKCDKGLCESIIMGITGLRWQRFVDIWRNASTIIDNHP